MDRSEMCNARPPPVYDLKMQVKLILYNLSMNLLKLDPGHCV